MQVLEALSNRVLEFGAWIVGLLVGGLFQVQCQVFQKCGWNAMLSSNRHTLSLEDSRYPRFWSRDPLEREAFGSGVPQPCLNFVFE